MDTDIYTEQEVRSLLLELEASELERVSSRGDESLPQFSGASDKRYVSNFATKPHKNPYWYLFTHQYDRFLFEMVESTVPMEEDRSLVLAAIFELQLEELPLLLEDGPSMLGTIIRWRLENHKEVPFKETDERFYDPGDLSS